MKKHFAHLLVLVLLLTVATPRAEAFDAGPYAKLNASVVGWSGVSGLLQNGWGVSGVGGIKLCRNFGVEGELGLTQNEIGPANLTTVPLFANAVIFLPLIDSFELSLGAGVGYGVVNLDAYGYNIAVTDGMAGQWKTGLSMRWGPFVSLEAQYAMRFLFEDTSVHQNLFSLGIGLKF